MAPLCARDAYVRGPLVNYGNSESTFDTMGILKRQTHQDQSNPLGGSPNEATQKIYPREADSQSAVTIGVTFGVVFPIVILGIIFYFIQLRNSKTRTRKKKHKKRVKERKRRYKTSWYSDHVSGSHDEETPTPQQYWADQPAVYLAGMPQIPKPVRKPTRVQQCGGGNEMDAPQIVYSDEEEEQVAMHWVPTSLTQNEGWTSQKRKGERVRKDRHGRQRKYRYQEPSCY